MTCAEFHDVAAELALGVLPGDRRADALAHADGCAACRAELEALARVADTLPVLVPPAEPPAGFDSRVLARVTNGRPRRAAVLVVAAVLLVAGGVGTAMYAAGARARSHAREYEAALGTLGGRSLRTGKLETTDGRAGGQVVVYDGRPSWVFVVVQTRDATGDYTIELRREGAAPLRLDGLHLDGGRGTFGGLVHGTVRSVRSVRVLAAGGASVLEAALGADAD
jgi:hypothetical protein